VRVAERDQKIFITETDDGLESSPFTGEYTKNVDHKVELHIDAEASLLDEVFVDGILLILGVDYLVTGDTIITYLPEFLDSLATGAYEAEVTFMDGFVEQGVLIIKELAPIKPPVSKKGGGGMALPRDHCPNGDFSPSYYDRTCGVRPGTENNQHGSAERGEYGTAYEWAYRRGITTMPTRE